MVASLLRYERIRTTVAKAKLIRPWAEKMITLGKKGTLHARRLALAFLRSKPAVAKLFRTIGPRFKDRPGGYTRIIRLAEAIRPARSDRIADFRVPAGFRLGDGTPMALIELVEADVTPREKRRRRGASPEPFRPRRELYKKAEARQPTGASAAGGGSEPSEKGSAGPAPSA